MREMLASHKELLFRLEKIEFKLAEHDHQILKVFGYLKKLEQTKRQELELKNRKKIGYQQKGK